MANCDQVYESFFKGLLRKFGSTGVSIPVRGLEVGSSSGEMERKKRRAKEIDINTSPTCKTLRDEGKGKEQVIVDIPDEESNKEFEETLGKELEIAKPKQEKEKTEGSEEEGDLTKEDLLQLIHEEDGMHKIVNVWSIKPSYEQDMIVSVLSSHLVHNHIKLEILQNTLLEEMFECIKETMDSVSQDKEEEEVILHLKK